MIAPRAAPRPRGQDDATSRASQTGAHEAHSGPEEHAPLAPTPGFRGLTLPPSFERSSTTSSPLRAREHAGSHARQDGAAEPGLARDHGADPRKAAVRLPEIGSFEALELPKNARCAGREPPLFSLSGGRRAPSWSTPTMPAHGVATPAWASACLQPAEGGEGSVFRGAARPPQGASRPREASVHGSPSDWSGVSSASAHPAHALTVRLSANLRARSPLRAAPTISWEPSELEFCVFVFQIFQKPSDH